VWERDNAHAEWGETNKFIGLSATIGLSAKSDQYAAETTDFYPDANPKPNLNVSLLLHKQYDFRNRK